jgi:uncharacterized protein (TIGR02246 family)
MTIPRHRLSAEIGPAMPANDQPIRDVLGRFLDAWNRHDVAAFAALYRADADFVDVYGTWWQGRAAIEAAHRASHAAVFRQSRLATIRTEVRFLAPEVATAHVIWELTGLVTPRGEALPGRRGILLHVLVKEGTSWSIVTTQNTDIVQPPG